MQKRAFIELIQTGKYLVKVVPFFNGGWSLELTRHDSDRVYMLESKRGDCRVFKSLTTAVKTALSFGADKVQVMKDRNFE